MTKIAKISGLLILSLLSITVIKAQENILQRISTSIEIEPFTTGYINSSGDTIIPVGKYSYCFTEKFDKIAFVVRKDLPGFYAIDRNENVLFRVRSLDNGPDPVNNGLFRIIENNKTGYADLNGKIIIQPQFEAALPFKNGFAVICIGGNDVTDGEYTLHDGGKWGLINSQGSIIVEAKYDEIRLSNKEGFAKIRVGGNYIRVGEYLELDGGKWGLIITEGRKILEPVYDRIEIQENGKVKVQKDGEWQIIDIKNLK